jgi:hypothetical protein
MCSEIRLDRSYHYLSEEVVTVFAMRPCFRLSEANMSTLLIVLLVLFVFGGGSWGYSRWRG